MLTKSNFSFNIFILGLVLMLISDVQSIDIIEKNANLVHVSRTGATVSQCTWEVNIKAKNFPFKSITTSGIPDTFYYGDFIIIISQLSSQIQQSPVAVIYDVNDQSEIVDFGEYICIDTPISTNFVSNFNGNLIAYNKKVPVTTSLGIISDTSSDYQITGLSTIGFFTLSSSTLLPPLSSIVSFRYSYPSGSPTQTTDLRVISGNLVRNFAITNPIPNFASDSFPTLLSYQDHSLYNSFMMNVSDPSGKALTMSFVKSPTSSFNEFFILPVYGNPTSPVYIGYKKFSFDPSLEITQDVCAVGVGNVVQLKSITYKAPSIASGTTSNLELFIKGSEYILTFQTFIPEKRFDYYKIGDLAHMNTITNTWSNYPYGFSGGNYQNFTWTKSLFIPKYKLNGNIQIATDVSKVYPYNTPADQTPLINKIEIKSFPNGNILLRLNATCGLSGLKSFSYFKEPIIASDLVLDSGSWSIYEKVFEVSKYAFTPSFFKLTNNYGSDSSISSSTNFTPNAGPKMTLNDIQSISFKENNVDLSNGGVWNTIYLQTKAEFLVDNTYFIPFKFISTTEILNDFINEDMQWDALYYNITEEKFMFSFYMPARLFTGSVNYALFIQGFILDPSMLSSLFSTANLQVVSSSADEMAPIVENITILRGEVLPNNTQTIGWRIQILDPLNGLESGNLTINSDIDYLGYKFTFGPCDSIDPYQGIYEFNITLDNNSCKTQTYSIKELTLRDTSGHFSNSTVSTKGQYPITHPFINTDNSQVTIICQ
ncbi:hypothetical protein CYY_008646, partial [Polysphondylium violaceum]